MGQAGRGNHPPGQAQTVERPAKAMAAKTPGGGPGDRESERRQRDA